MNQRACQLIWYSVIDSKSAYELTNNPLIGEVIPKKLEIGQGFTLSHFVAFLLRFSIIYFNYSNENPEQFSVTKKVLSILRKLEVSDALRNFLTKLNRTYSVQMSFLPSKKLIAEFLRNEGTEINHENPNITKEEMISTLFNFNARAN